MKHTTLSVLLLSLLAAAPACKSKDSGGKGSAKSTESKGGGAAPAAKGGTIAAFKLGYDGPAGDASDMSMGGDPSWMVQADGLVFTVTAVKDPSQKTLETAVEDSKMYDGSQITVQEKTADGYHLEFHNSGSMGANYFVEIVRAIGGTTYVCGTTAPDTTFAAAAVKACQSLHAL